VILCFLYKFLLVKLIQNFLKRDRDKLYFRLHPALSCGAKWFEFFGSGKRSLFCIFYEFSTDISAEPKFGKSPFLANGVMTFNRLFIGLRAFRL
jgi:hypothetical protein